MEEIWKKNWYLNSISEMLIIKKNLKNKSLKMKFFLYVTMTVACLVQGIRVGQHQQSAPQSHSLLELKAQRGLKMAFVDGIMDLLHYLESENKTSINEQEFIDGAKGVLMGHMAKKVDEMDDKLKEAFAHLDKNGDG